jgi:hypothetical protein
VRGGNLPSESPVYDLAVVKIFNTNAMVVPQETSIASLANSFKSLQPSEKGQDVEKQKSKSPWISNGF